MDNVSLLSLSYQLAAFRSMDVIANNIANASTPGYKRESAKFEEFIQQVKPSETQKGSQSLSFVKDAGVLRDLSGGRLENTGARYDLAINVLRHPHHAPQFQISQQPRMGGRDGPGRIGFHANRQNRPDAPCRFDHSCR